jgi:hypothetical protein
MKKILIALVVLLFSVPAWADVNITAAQVPNTREVIISFDARTEPNLVRAFGINVQCDNDANVIAVGSLSTDYYIFPGTIQIDADGEVQDYGSPAAEYGDLPSDTLEGPPDGNGVTIEMASLYYPPASPANAPDPCGLLVSITVDKDCWLCLAANVSRAGATGVVMESPDEVVTVNYSDCIYVKGPAEECMKTSHFAYVDWGAWDKPKCWCYRKQCRGDINGSSFFGKTVTLADLNIFRAAYNKTDAELALVENGICADLNMASFFGKRVTLADLNIFRTYYNVVDASVPCCDEDQDCVLTAEDDYNYWEEP